MAKGLWRFLIGTCVDQRRHPGGCGEMLGTQTNGDSEAFRRFANSKWFRLFSYLQPAADAGLVLEPVGTEGLLKLTFLSTNEKIHQGQMGSGDQERARRSEEQPCSEKDENVTAEIERISREAIWTGSDQRPLRGERDYSHLALVEIVGGPHAQQKTGVQEQPARSRGQNRVKITPAKKQVKASSEIGDAETDQNHANIVKNALQQIYGRGAGEGVVALRRRTRSGLSAGFFGGFHW